MQKLSAFSTDDEPTELPPGFRFHPTDEELITHYLSPKVLDSSFTTKAVGEVDLNKVEPWDLPWKAKVGEKECYFFCVRDRKYPTGLRTNRATDAGYWKATGKDKEIIRDKILVGMKKTLVFYKGRAPRGEKTDWVMHEYRLEGQLSMRNLSKPAKNEWVVCRIFKKSLGVKKVHVSGLVRSSDSGSGSLSSDLPPLTDFSSDENHSRQRGSAEGSSSKNCGVSPFPFEFSKVPTQNSISDSVFLQDHSIVRLLLENNVPDTMRSARAEFSQGFCPDMSYHEMEFKPYLDQAFPTVGTAPVDLGCLWDLDKCM